MRPPLVTRRYSFDPPRPLIVEIHDQDCTGPCCQAYRPIVPAPLTAQAIAKLSLAAVAFGHLVAAALLGPGTVLHILVATLAGQPL